MTQTWRGRVVPTFRPDKLPRAGSPTWNADVDRLAEVSGIETGDYAGYLAAMEDRRQYFKDNGAVSADHSHLDARTDPLEVAEAERIYALARKRRDHRRSRRPRYAVICVLRDGPDGVRRRPGDDTAPRRAAQPPPATFEQYGADVGTDIPVQMEFTDALRPMLNRYGTHPNFQLVIFTVDETMFSREIAPLAGFYPSVFAGVPVVVPRRPGGDPPLPRRHHRVGRLRQDLRLHRRHPRLLLHPGPPRHVPSAGCRLRRAAGGRAPSRRGRGDRGHARPGRHQPEKGVQTVTAAPRQLPDCPVRCRTRPPAAPVRMVHLGVGNFHRAHQAWYTAHALTPTMGHRGLHRPPARHRRCPRPQDGLYTLITRSAEGDTFELMLAGPIWTASGSAWWSRRYP